MPRLVTIATYASPIEAQLAQARLSAEGIEAIVADEQVGSMLPLHVGALGGVRLQVHEEDEQAAIEVLEVACEDVGADEEEDGEACPRCGAGYVEYTRTLQETTIGVLTAGAGFLAFPRRWHCQRCSHAWAGPPPSPRASSASVQTSTPYRSAGRRPEEAPPRICFRFPTTRAGVGAFFGGVLGMLGFGVLDGTVALVLPLAAPALGWLAGRTVVTYACSACRRSLVQNAKRCPRCRGVIKGLIARPDDHFRAVAEVSQRERSRRKRARRAERRPVVASEA